MNETLLYHLSLVTCGCVVGATGLTAAASGEGTVAPIAVTVGGTLMVAGSAYDGFVAAGPLSRPTDDRILWLTVSAGFLAGILGLRFLLL